jgi:UDP-N-acetyl-D-galactosamine dehydrogenase
VALTFRSRAATDPSSFQMTERFTHNGRLKSETLESPGRFHAQKENGVAMLDKPLAAPLLVGSSLSEQIVEASSHVRIAVVGLGYVGLPLAVEFGKHLPVVGFDVNPARIAALEAGHDATLEISDEELRGAADLSFTHDLVNIADCNVFIVTVPTPIDGHKRPDLTPLIKASQSIGKVLKRNDTVIYESTVYPGATEEECVPVLEAFSGLTFNKDFYVGYSPERINPGDKQHRLSAIKKVTSGSTPAAAEKIDRLYAQIIAAGTHKAPSIKVAEAAKVIENTQRDLNIALVNELAIIFGKMGIDTEAVLRAAGTKWNFLPFRPGLVGGHCIGVDPYYLTHKAQAIGYHPEIILAGRRLNDGMGSYVVSQLVKAMLKRRIQVEGARVLVMGLTFKENCPDIRNTRVVDIVRELDDYNVCTDVFDPWVDVEEAKREYGITPVTKPLPRSYDAIVVAVAHNQFRAMGAQTIRELGRDGHVLYDLKYILGPDEADVRL